MVSALFGRFQHAHATLRSLVPQLGTSGLGEILGCLIAMARGTILSLWLARKAHSIPAFVLVIPLVFMLSPGSHGVRQFEPWFSGPEITGVNDLKMLGGILLAIGLGMTVGGSLTSHRHWFNNWSKASQD